LQEYLFLYKLIESQTTVEDIFQVLDQFVINHRIGWNRSISVCIDGMKSVRGKTAGIVARIKTVSKTCTSSHFSLRIHALAVKRMPNSVKSLLGNAVSTNC
jgi:hypothetical protein